jgi:scyllo-inositol 2-dehydrogenase (NADP+)
MTRVAVTAVPGDGNGDGDLARAARAVADHLVASGLGRTDDLAGADVVLVWAAGPLPPALADALSARLAAGRPVLLAGPAAVPAETSDLAEAAGLVVEGVTPVHPVRLRPGRDAGELAARWTDVEVVDCWLRVDKARDDVEVLLTAMSGLSEHPVMTWRPSTGVGVLGCGSRPDTLGDPAYRRLVARWVRRVAGHADAAAVGVGLLGLGAIADEHLAAVADVAGLELAAVCDVDPGRLAAARERYAAPAAYAGADQLLADPDVDLVVVSTPPSSHAGWAMRALEAGKHVVVEKPFCITTKEADEMLAAAAAGDRLLAVYQNRRWDADYVALRSLVRAGGIGEVFHYESFVGGYGHPCNFWHSDEDVSGGAVYDWGSHHLDWVLDLLPQEVGHVTAATHKRRWHDVTNADHTRVTIRFSDGAEAEFVHSDLAAALKPKWYVLGTEGAVVGHWRRERVVTRDAVGALVEEHLAPADSPASLELHHGDGSVTALAIPPRPRHPFHRELADRLLSGAPMTVTAESARRNIAVMEAAVTSAREDGRPVTPL